MVTDQNISFLVADSCSVMVRNGKSISADVIEDVPMKTISMTFVSAFFRQFGIDCGLFDFTRLTQYMYIACKSKIYLHSKRNGSEKFIKVHLIFSCT